MRSPRDVGRHAHDGRRAGRRADGRRLGDLPGVLDRRVADDRLVDLEAAVDDVQQDGLAGHEVERVGQERVVLGDEVDLARRAPTSRARSAAVGRAPPPALARGDATSDGDQRGSEQRDGGLTDARSRRESMAAAGSATATRPAVA